MFFSFFYFFAVLATAEMAITTEQCVPVDCQQTEVNKQEINISSPVTKPIVITNNITPAMLSYKHWTGTYSPDVFMLYINDIHVPVEQTHTLLDATTPLIIRFDYSFMNGLRKGTKTVSYQLNSDITSAQLTFSWLEPHKVIIDNGTLITEKN